VASSKKLLPFALAAVMGLSSVACGGGLGGAGMRPNDAADGSRLGTREPSRMTGFLDPRTDEQARNLFVVEADHAEYWRMFTLDRYDGESWTSSNPDASGEGVLLSPPASLPPFGDGLPTGAQTLIQTVRILNDFDSGHVLPMAQTPEEITGPIGNITWDPARSQAFIDGDLEAGMTYTVRSRIVVPTPEELDQVDLSPPGAYRRWTELPGDLDQRIERIAEHWTAHVTSDYRKVLAIQQHFHNGAFVYSTDVDTADDAEGVFEFLTQTRPGFVSSTRPRWR
jgi:hypothetical protein